jgi:hypothetical protein
MISQLEPTRMRGNVGVLPTIHMFWHGAPLSRLERLCIASFVANGHSVHLHAYEELPNVPSGAQLQDANRILPHSAMFRHSKSRSLAPFADWFRYRLLAELGGIWADTDVVCLRPFDYSQPTVFGWMSSHAINNAVLGLPAAHPLAFWMAECCERPNRLLSYDDSRTRRRKLKRRFLQGDRRGNIRWGEYGPQGFTSAAKHLGYAELALPYWHFYPIHYENWNAVFDGSLAEHTACLNGSRGLHLWNEMSRLASGFEKNARFPRESRFEQLCAKYLRD